MSSIEITKEIAKTLLPQRPSDANKGTFGKVLNIAGCANYRGAACLSSVSPLKVGAGLVTLASVEAVINSVASLCPSLTFFELNNEDGKYISSSAFQGLVDIIDGYDVVSVGPGLSVQPCVREFFVYLLEYIKDEDLKFVFDADALNIIAELDFSKLPKNSVLTPHPKELSRLLKKDTEEIQRNRISSAMEASEKYGCGIILKGQGTVVCFGQDVFINTTGNSAMSKAGSGDVLTGIISGLCAQGLSVKDASVLGVYMHGLCGELASQKLTNYCVMATDLIDFIPDAIKLILE